MMVFSSFHWTTSHRASGDNQTAHRDIAAGFRELERELGFGYPEISLYIAKNVQNARVAR